MGYGIWDITYVIWISDMGFKIWDIGYIGIIGSGILDMGY